MKQLPIVTGMIFALAGAPAMAHSINFDKVEVGFKRLSHDDSGIESFDTYTGVNLVVSKRVDNHYFEGRYYSVGGSGGSGHRYESGHSYHSRYELDIDQFSLGAGYVHELDEISLFDVSFHIGRVDLRSEFEVTETYLASVYQYNLTDSGDENIYRLRAQYQTRVLEDIELKAGLGYEKIDGEGSDGNPLFFVGAGYHFNDIFSVNAEYRNVDDYDTLDINFRYSF
ncbi:MULTISPECIES: hypothetical protein [unclassified Pseudoalteromonas]|uniref:hypothetical protein n=1 Tax=unclassified Pseudoalteromonas TaxID=194690 RepID=UPI002097B1B4|nr:hypothetical protein [Pseudoalteromonas sp. XMcav2-N]MCO7190831.1 hypothetical protein [Pseudoalteromonas sp. XMcav2-N]